MTAANVHENYSDFGIGYIIVYQVDGKLHIFNLYLFNLFLVPCIEN